MNFIEFLSILVLVGVGVLAHDEDVYTIQYDSESFAEEVPKKNHFVMFYAPWCGHCQRLAPTWEQLAEMLNEDTSNIRIAKVDCTIDNKICLEQDVTGYPTLKFFKVGESEGVKFKGTRDLPSLTSFINEQVRSKEDDSLLNIVETANKLIELTEDTFDEHIKSGRHFIKFYAPWCGHCQKLAPVWEELAQNMQEEIPVKIAKIDCTVYRTICNQFEIKGYPTLLWIEDGQKVEKYNGARTHDTLKEYVIKMIGNESVKKDEETGEKIEVQSKVLELTSDNFDKISDTIFALVKFYAPWCGHCKRLAPTWEDLGKVYADDDQVTVVKVDCASDDNKNLCSDQDVQGFPTIILYKKGKRVEEYEGKRDLSDFKTFINKHKTEHDEL